MERRNSLKEVPTMANTTSEASVNGVPEVVPQDRLSDWLAHDHSLAESLRLVSGKELVTAIEEKNEQDNVSEVRSSKRWRALDQLLRTSFELISPAYLFTSFPPVR
jgi:hypothetical protein